MACPRRLRRKYAQADELKSRANTFARLLLDEVNKCKDDFRKYDEGFERLRVEGVGAFLDMSPPTTVQARLAEAAALYSIYAEALCMADTTLSELESKRELEMAAQQSRHAEEVAAQRAKFQAEAEVLRSRHAEEVAAELSNREKEVAALRSEHREEAARLSEKIAALQSRVDEARADVTTARAEAEAAKTALAREAAAKHEALEAKRKAETALAAAAAVDSDPTPREDEDEDANLDPKAVLVPKSPERMTNQPGGEGHPRIIDDDDMHDVSLGEERRPPAAGEKWLCTSRPPSGSGLGPAAGAGKQGAPYLAREPQQRTIGEAIQAMANNTKRPGDEALDFRRAIADSGGANILPRKRRSEPGGSGQVPSRSAQRSKPFCPAPALEEGRAAVDGSHRVQDTEALAEFIADAHDGDAARSTTVAALAEIEGNIDQAKHAREDNQVATPHGVKGSLPESLSPEIDVPADLGRRAPSLRDQSAKADVVQVEARWRTKAPSNTGPAGLRQPSAAAFQDHLHGPATVPPPGCAIESETLEGRRPLEAHALEGRGPAVPGPRASLLGAGPRSKLLAETQMSVVHHSSPEETSPEPEKAPPAADARSLSPPRPAPLPTPTQPQPRPQDGAASPKAPIPAGGPGAMGLHGGNIPKQTVVRGNARKDVPAYFCKECDHVRRRPAGGIADVCSRARRPSVSQFLDAVNVDREIRCRFCRHRAEFQPVNTPDKFWQVSMPESETLDGGLIRQCISNDPPAPLSLPSVGGTQRLALLAGNQGDGGDGPGVLAEAPGIIEESLAEDELP